MTLFNTITPETQKLIDENSELINEKLEDWIDMERKLRGGIAGDVLRMLTLAKRRKFAPQQAIKVTFTRTRLIERLVKLGVTNEQFQGMIEYKVEKDWNTDQQQYLRPETLFAEANFFKYLEEAREFYRKEKKPDPKPDTPSFKYDPRKAVV